MSAAGAGIAEPFPIGPIGTYYRHSPGLPSDKAVESTKDAISKFSPSRGLLGTCAISHGSYLSHAQARGNDPIRRVMRLCPVVLAGPHALRRRRHGGDRQQRRRARSEEHTSELQSLMRNSYAVFCLKK